VTIVVVNLDGADLLPPCLDSLRQLDYAGERQLIVVDNGSTDGSLELLNDRYPEATVLAQDHNTGFAGAVNQGARAGTGTYLALLNNDMRVDPSWLRELVNGVGPATRTVCVAGLITSDDGTTVDFADASLSFNGRGDQPGFGSPSSVVNDADARELLFACGGSLLIDRRVFLDVGGFDETYFAYLEDVDLGWRLNLLGYQVVLAPGARSFHLHHGTADRFPRYQRELLIERNALATVIKNYDDAHLAEVLVPALLLLAKRGVLKADLDRSAFDIGGSTDEEQLVGRDALSALVAAADITDDLPGLFERRRVVQAARRCPDDDLIARFGYPLRPPCLDAGYLGDQIAAVREFGLDDAFARQRAARVLVLAADGDDALAEVGAVTGRHVPTSIAADIDDQPVLCRSADVVVGRADALAGMAVLGGRWPVVVVAAGGGPPADLPARLDAVLLLDEGARPEWQRVLGTDADAGDRSLLLDGSGPQALRPVLDAPWKWRDARRRAVWREAATEDVNLLLEARLAERLDVERRLTVEQYAHWLDLQALAGTRGALARRRNEVEELRARLTAAGAEIEGLAHRLAMVRHPLRTLVRIAGRARR